MARRRTSVKALQYSPELVPEAGQEVVQQLAAPIKSVGKDPAGWIFHSFALKQSGFFGETQYNMQTQECEAAIVGGPSLESFPRQLSGRPYVSAAEEPEEDTTEQDSKDLPRKASLEDDQPPPGYVITWQCITCPCDCTLFL